ncbi:Rad1-domain-containing protein [Atractiella rhizophila]|nr:Rad1-domain-containing protein [Atractiella rhizophila]
MISENGIKLTVMCGKTAQAHAYLLKPLFSTYTYTPGLPSTIPTSSPSLSSSQPNGNGPSAHDDIEINLHTMIECLNIFGSSNSSFAGERNEWKKKKRMGWGSDDEDESFERGREREESGGGTGKSTSLRISYRGEGHPFILILEEGGVVARSELTTYEAEPELDLHFVHDEQRWMVIMKSQYLSDGLSSLDPSASSLSFIFSSPSSSQNPNKTPTRSRPTKRRKTEEGTGNVFRLEAKGALGSSSTEFGEDRDVVELFEGTGSEGEERYAYKYGVMLNVKKALQISQKTSMRVNEEGLLSMQFQMLLDPGSGGRGKGETHGYVEFLCLPLIDGED